MTPGTLKNANFDLPVAVIGIHKAVMLEVVDGWTMNELCRFADE